MTIDKLTLQQPIEPKADFDAITFGEKEFKQFANEIFPIWMSQLLSEEIIDIKGTVFQTNENHIFVLSSDARSHIDFTNAISDSENIFTFSINRNNEGKIRFCCDRGIFTDDLILLIRTFVKNCTNAILETRCVDYFLIKVGENAELPIIYKNNYMGGMVIFTNQLKDYHLIISNYANLLIPPIIKPKEPLPYAIYYIPSEQLLLGRGHSHAAFEPKYFLDQLNINSTEELLYLMAKKYSYEPNNDSYYIQVTTPKCIFDKKFKKNRDLYEFIGILNFIEYIKTNNPEIIQIETDAINGKLLYYDIDDAISGLKNTINKMENLVNEN